MRIWILAAALLLSTPTVRGADDAAALQEAPAVEAAGEPAEAATDPQAEADAGADAQAPAAAAKPRAPLNLSARPSSIHYRHYINFDEHGEPHHESRQLTFGLACDLPGDLAPLTYQIESLDVVAATGQVLEPTFSKGENSLQRHPNQARQSLNINFNLPTLPPHNRSLAKASGVLKLRVGKGPLRRAVIGPFKDVVGKRASIIEYPGLTVTMKRQEQGVQVMLEGRHVELFDRASFLSGEGVDIPGQQWSSGSSGDNTVYRSYRLTMPDDGQVVLVLWSGTEEVEARFEVRDLPLPRPVADDAFDLAFHALPIEGEGAAHGEPIRGDLNVVVD